MAISASPQDQAQLLVLAELDTKLIQLAHKRASVNEVKQAHDLEVLLGSIDLKIVAVDTEISDLESAVTKAELDVEQVRSRAQRDQERMDSGAVSAKDLESLSHELQSLAKRQAELEEVELEVMQTLEEATVVKAGLVEQRVDVQAQFSEAHESATSQLAEIDAQVAFLTAERNDKASSIPKDLVEFYEKVRGDFGGIGAAEIKNGECQGCHISLDAAEISNIRNAPADQVLRCQECRLILVRA